MQKCKGRVRHLLIALVCGFLLLQARVSVSAEKADEVVFFPEGEVFQPLVADPKEPRFFGSIQHVENEFKDTFTGAFVGYGETFGLVRKNLGEDHAWQLSLRGGLFAQFDMDTSSNNLQNADYTIGALWAYQYEALALRFRLYHQSSHLGDEFILAQPEQAETRTGFDYEAADLLFSLTWKPFRIYGGGHYLLQRDPEELDRGGYQAGFEYHGETQILPYCGPVAGVDVKGFEQLDWEEAYSIKAGLHFSGIQNGQRYIQVLLEYYNGFIPFGQFYDFEMESYGAGIYFGF